MAKHLNEVQDSLYRAQNIIAGLFTDGVSISKELDPVGLALIDAIVYLAHIEHMLDAIGKKPKLLPSVAGNLADG